MITNQKQIRSSFWAANPDFHWSTNPTHIKAAKKQQERVAKAEEKKQKLLAQKRKLISPLLETYRDQEECYDLEYLPPETLERLTVEQLKTFLSWLK